MRTSWAGSDGTRGRALNYWLGAANSRGVELRDEDIASLCFAEPGAIIEGMNIEQRKALSSVATKEK